jgi:hypothetical protein
MSFRRGGAGKRRDAIEPQIIKILKRFGATVLQINGRHLPDVLCEHRGRWVPLGIKSGEKASLTAGEKAGKALWPIVRNEHEAMEAVFGNCQLCLAVYVKSDPHQSGAESGAVRHGR